MNTEPVVAHELAMRLVELLSDLVETCRDGALVYTRATTALRDPTLQSFLRDRAEERAAFAKSLTTLINESGLETKSPESVRRLVRRLAVGFRATFARIDEVDVLEMCVRYERVTLERYESAVDLLDAMPDEVGAIVARQYRTVIVRMQEMRMQLTRRTGEEPSASRRCRANEPPDGQSLD